MTSTLTTQNAPHTCHAQQCDVEVEPAMFMCRPHWFMVPPPLREAIKGSYRPGQEVDKQASSGVPRPRPRSHRRRRSQGIARRTPQSTPTTPTTQTRPTRPLRARLSLNAARVPCDCGARVDHHQQSVSTQSRSANRRGATDRAASD
jgi:hypothetical protein